MTDSAVKWDRETDVVVLGYGYAGASSAIYANDAGARVLILEKMAHFGGYSILAGGGLIFGTDGPGLLRYFRELCSGRTPDDVIEAQVDGLTRLYGYLDDLCGVNGAKTRTSGGSNEPDSGPSSGSAACYPLPGGESIRTVRVVNVPGFKGYPWFPGVTPGVLLMKVLEDNVVSRGIQVELECPAQELVTDCRGAVTGVKAQKEGRPVYIKARRAVIIATGGFESNEWMKMQFWQAKPVYSMGPPCNTGDGIVMAQKAGAALWHMWHFHGSYGFKFPEHDSAFRVSLSGFRNPRRVVPWIIVDKISGKRFMNEVQPAPQDTNHRPLEYFDPDLRRPDFPRIPCWMLLDEEGRKRGPVASPQATSIEGQYRWSPDNSAEVEKGWILTASTLEELADKIEVNAGNLIRTILRWNELVGKGDDEDFGRPPGTMAPVSTPPFYAVRLWPIVTNTQGGPEHNAAQQVVDAFRRPIPRLYAAGECGSMYGHLYQLAGNMSECIVTGKIAGDNAAREEA